MSLKKILTLTTAAMAATTMVAQAEVGIDVVSHYVFRGGAITFEETKGDMTTTNVSEWAVQPGFETEILGGAATVGTWASFNTDLSEFEEIDYYIDIPLPLGEDSPISGSIGYTEYTYPYGGGDADREPYLSFGAEPLEGVEASLLLAYGIDGGIDGDFYSELGLGTSVAVGETASLDLGGSVAYVDPDEGESGVKFASVSAGVSCDYGGVAVAYIIETDDDVLEVEEDVIVSVSFSL